MIITLDMIHQQTEGLSGREIHAALKLHQLHINERQMRHFMTGHSVMPEAVFRALRDYNNELLNSAN